MLSTNRLKFRIALTLFLALTWPHSSFGQSRVAESFELAPPKMFWKQVEVIVEIGIAENPELLAIRVAEAVSKGNLRQSRLFPNPVLGLQWERGRTEMSGERMLSIDVPLPIDGRRGAAVKTAEATLEEVRFGIAEKERLLRREIRDAVTMVVEARLRKEFLSLSLELVEKSRSLISDSVEQGSRAPLELNKENVFLNSIRAKLELAEGNLAEAESALATLLGRGSLAGIELPQSLPGFDHEKNPREWIRRDPIDNRPDVAASRARISVAEGLLRAARAEGRPSFDFMFGIRDMKSGFPLNGLNMSGGLSPIEERMRFTGYGLKVRIPFFDRNQGGISAAEGLVESSRRMSLSTEISARNDVSLAVTRYDRTTRSLEIMSKAVIQQARDNLRVVGLSYDEGAVSLDEYLRERRLLIDLELDFIESARANALAESALMASFGVSRRCELTTTCSKTENK